MRMEGGRIQYNTTAISTEKISGKYDKKKRIFQQQQKKTWTKIRKSLP